MRIDSVDAGSLVTTISQLMDPLAELYHQQKAVSSHSLKPPSTVVRHYESAVYAFRDQRLPSDVKAVSQLLVDSVEAFEGGRVLDAGRAVMQALELFETAAKDGVISLTSEQWKAVGQFRSQLFKMVVPSPELKQKRIDL